MRKYIVPIIFLFIASSLAIGADFGIMWDYSKSGKLTVTVKPQKNSTDSTKSGHWPIRIAVVKLASPGTKISPKEPTSDFVSSNKFQINDKSFYYWYMAEKEPSRKALLYADSMMIYANEENDDKARTLSYVAKFNYWVDEDDDQQIDASAEAARESALETGYLQYYFYTYNQQVTKYIRKQQISKAMNLAAAMNRAAKELNNDYGRFTSNMSMANVYNTIGNNKEETYYLRQAIEVAPYVSHQTSTATAFGRLSLRMNTWDEKHQLLNEALELCRDSRDSGVVYTFLLQNYYERRDSADFMRVYGNIFDSGKENAYLNPTLKGQVQREMYTIQGRWDEALQLIEETSVKGSSSYFFKLFGLYHYKRDFKTSLKYHVLYDSVLNVERKANYLNEVANFKAMIAHNALEYEELQQRMLRMEAEAKRAEAEAATLKAEAAAAKAENERASALAKTQANEARQKALKAEAKQEEVRAQRARSEARQAKLKLQLASEMAKEVEAKNQMHVMHLIFGLFIIVALVVIIWVMIISRQQRQIRKINEELALAHQSIVDANRKKDIFLQNMSHEIRTPLNAVMGLSQILTCPGLPVSEEEKAEYGADILNNASMLSMLIDDIVNISEIEKSNYKFVLQPFKIANICEAAMSVVQYRVPSRVEMRFENELPEDYTCVIDPQRAQQVITNYLTNACKHTSEGSIVLRATLNDNPGYVTFMVTDTGEGVPADQAVNIFERFTKLNDFVQGTGLGLNICSTIASKLNGRVWLDTEYTSGARFCFECPTDLQKSQANP